MYPTVVWLALTLAGRRGPAPASSSTAKGSLDYEFFKAKVQPIFSEQASRHARCIACHGQGTPLRLQPVAAGSSTWSEEDSRKNFETIKRVAQPGT
jgi:cytochrome c553